MIDDTQLKNQFENNIKATEVESFKIPDDWYHQGIYNLRKADIKYPYQKWQIDEILKCKKDPIYFIKNFVKIMNPDEGLIKFKLYDYQEEMVNLMHTNRFTILKIPRQSGKTNTTAAYALHQLLFKDTPEFVGIVAHKKEMATDITSKIQLMYIQLPFWMQKGILSWQKTSFTLEDHAFVISDATSQSSLRGRTVTLLIWDEVSYVHPNLADGFLKSVYPTISKSLKSRIIASSTPQGYNHFAKMWNDAKNKISSFVPFEIKWSDVPGRDEKFKEETIKNTSLSFWLQEFECEILSSGHTLIKGTKLASMNHINPITTGMDGDLCVYEQPVKNHIYVTVFDPSEGKGLDYYAMSIFDVTQPPYTQVLTYRNNTNEWEMMPYIIDQLSSQYGEDNIIVVENNFKDTILYKLNYELESECFIYSDAGQLGLRTSVKTKRIGCTSLKNLIESDKLIVHDFNTIQELYKFVLKGTGYKAEEGEGNTDDLVMTLVIFSYFTTTAFFAEYVNSGKSLREKLYADKEKMIEDDIPSFGMIVSAGDDEITLAEKFDY